ncbi:hypothetical protein Nepgr_019467 [Nepenthes gracilis]|uniref:Neprosin activation peptide domain-containing protein n=1 Tax=Nepenthes gracilis TaxID=150966 RepID=A0AAD3XVD3_NEPGR|nr:hypothetical protein Nepgr_019467 [Nepenthes gracilis]
MPLPQSFGIFLSRQGKDSLYQLPSIFSRPTHKDPMAQNNQVLEATQLETLKEVYTDPPRGTVKTIVTEDGEVVDFVNINEQPAFDHPLLKDHKIQMNPSVYPSGCEAQPNNNPAQNVFSTSKYGDRPEGTIPIIRCRRGHFRKTTGPAAEFPNPRINNAGSTAPSETDSNA